MLKRNGQLCQHSVPDYAGHLTDAEFAAYNSVFTVVEGDFKELSAITKGLTELERALPEFLKMISSPTSQHAGGEGGCEWQVLAPLPDTQHGQLLWCKRRLGELEEFAVVERFPEDSPLAKVQGKYAVQMTDSDPSRLLCDFINARRDTAQLFANDIIATAQEQAAEMYAGEDMNRVMEAISHRCIKSIAPGQKLSTVQARRGEGMHV